MERPGAPLSLDDVRRLASRYVEHGNTVLLHSAPGCVTPQAILGSRQKEIWAETGRKLGAACGANIVPVLPPGFLPWKTLPLSRPWL
jgi:hypothetical protein